MRVFVLIMLQMTLPWDSEVWYAQQWTQEELDEAKSRGLL